MVSRATLTLHTFLFASFVIASRTASALLLWCPGVLEGKVVVIAGVILAVLVIGSWPAFGGECPFTAWENDARKREGRRVYRGPCIDHYARAWFGITLRGQTSTCVLVLLLLLPIVLGALHW